MSLDKYIQEVTAQWESETGKLKKFPLWKSANDNQAAIIPYFSAGISPKGAVIICAGGAYMWKEPLEAFPHVKSDTAPAFIWGMQGDWQFKQNQWKYYTDALDEKEISYSYHVFPNGSHNEGRECKSPIWKQWTMRVSHGLVI